MAELERVAVQGDDPHLLVAGQEAAQVRDPARSPDRGSGERMRRQRSRDAGEVRQEVGEAVAGRPSRHPVAGGVVIPGELSIELGLVAKLEGGD